MTRRGRPASSGSDPAAGPDDRFATPRSAPPPPTCEQPSRPAATSGAADRPIADPRPPPERLARRPDGATPAHGGASSSGLVVLAVGLWFFADGTLGSTCPTRAGASSGRSRLIVVGLVWSSRGHAADAALTTTTPGRRATARPRRLWLADWRRRVGGAVRRGPRDGRRAIPAVACAHWRDVREQLFREHPAVAGPVAERAAFRGAPLRPTTRAALRPWSSNRRRRRRPARSPSSCRTAAPTRLSFSRRRVAVGRLPFPDGARPSRSSGWRATRAACSSRSATRRTAPRPTAPGATSRRGQERRPRAATRRPARSILDFNFAFQPSCAFDPRWACPLAPPENRLDIRDQAGERLA